MSAQVYVDGGVRRGTDVFKALALGAKAVGIGRPVLYGLAGYGQDGVERVLQIFKVRTDQAVLRRAVVLMCAQEELDVCMRLMGTPTIADIKPCASPTRDALRQISRSCAAIWSSLAILAITLRRNQRTISPRAPTSRCPSYKQSRHFDAEYTLLYM